jgi:hypothetical protein
MNDFRKQIKQKTRGNFFGKFPSRLPFGLSLIILGNGNGQGDISVEQFR